MTGFHDVRFPDAIARGATGGPEYSTDIVSVASGYEQRNVNWTAARARYDIGTGIRTREQMAEVIAFFRARKGRAYGFRFRDWTDFEAVGQAMLATADPLVWQLVRRYPSGPSEDVRKITKPEVGSVVVRVDGSVAAGAKVELSGFPSSDCDGPCVQFALPDGTFRFAGVSAFLSTRPARAGRLFCKRGRRKVRCVTCVQCATAPLRSRWRTRAMPGGGCVAREFITVNSTTLMPRRLGIATMRLAPVNTPWPTRGSGVANMWWTHTPNAMNAVATSASTSGT